MILSSHVVRSPQLNQNLLSRWEVVALLNVLYRFSESLHATEDFRRIWNERKATEARSAAAGASPAHEAQSNGDTTPFGTPASQHESIFRPPKAQPLPPHSHSATSSQTAIITNTTAKTAIQIQNLGRSIYAACKRSTVGCLNVISGFAQSILQRFSDWYIREGRTTSGDL